MNFKEAYELPIGKHVEKKGKFSYLSWCYAVKHLRENFKDATWLIKENDNGQPLFQMPQGYMVCVTVVVDGCEFPQWHPVLDFKNKPIPEPNAFDVNTAIQRCLTKAIGLATGIGLGLYAGEDLPQEPKKSYADFEAELDKCETVEDVDMWVNANWGNVKQDLNKTDLVKLTSYGKQIKDVFKRSEENE